MKSIKNVKYSPDGKKSQWIESLGGLEFLAERIVKKINGTTFIHEYRMRESHPEFKSRVSAHRLLPSIPKPKQTPEGM